MNRDGATPDRRAHLPCWMLLCGLVGLFGGLLRATADVAAWGQNGFGQTNVPANLGDAIGIAAGGYHSVAWVGDACPEIGLAPASQTRLTGENAWLQPSFGGRPPLSFRWQFLGTNIPGATQGVYRAQAVRRVYIPKANGKLRPLGIPTVSS